MENTVPDTTTPPVTAVNPDTTPHPVSPDTTTGMFAKPPEGGSKLPIVITISVILLLIVLGLTYYFFFMKKTPKVETPTTQNTLPQSVPATPTPTPYDTTDAGLVNDTSDIEINLSTLETSAASVESGLTESTPNL